jgi:hypothetical protein
MKPTKQDPEERVRDNEPPEMRVLSKKKIHERLAIEYFLPPMNSRGANRSYLVGVFTGDHFRVRTTDIKHFEAELTPAQKKKAPVLFCSTLVSKLNHLLQETNRPPLGFDVGMVPEEEWLVSITRYVDRTNILDVFLQPVPGAQPPVCVSQRMFTAKINAERYLLLGNNLMANNNIYKQIETIHDLSKRLAGHRRELQSLVDKGRVLEETVNTESGDLSDKMYKAALSVFNQGNHNVDAGIIFNEQNGPQSREQLGQIREM